MSTICSNCVIYAVTGTKKYIIYGNFFKYLNGYSIAAKLSHMAGWVALLRRNERGGNTEWGCLLNTKSVSTN